MCFVELVNQDDDWDVQYYNQVTEVVEGSFVMENQDAWGFYSPYPVDGGHDDGWTSYNGIGEQGAYVSVPRDWREANWEANIADDFVATHHIYDEDPTFEYDDACIGAAFHTSGSDYDNFYININVEIIDESIWGSEEKYGGGSVTFSE